MEILRLSTGFLEEKGVENPRLTAEILLSHILGCRRIDLYLWFDRPMEESELSTMRRYLRLRAGGMPVDYITKRAEFYGLQLLVDQRVMVPRPETEVLVEEVLSLVSGPFTHRKTKSDFLFLDIGTGSGAISFAILDQLPEAIAVASDISLDALRVACTNAMSLELSYRFNPVLGDIYQPIKQRTGFELIVSNPPYIADRDRDNLPKEVRDYEPVVALFAGEDGLGITRKIIDGAADYLKTGGILALEIGEKQGEVVGDMVDKAPGLIMVALEKDLSGIERIVIARKEGT
jgi:release factor glutamine methyltransferase